MNFVTFRTHTITYLTYFISSKIIPISTLYFKRSSILMHDVSNDSAPPIASMARSLFQVKITITTPDPLQLLIFIGNTLD